MWYKETGSEEGVQLVSFLINGWCAEVAVLLRLCVENWLSCTQQDQRPDSARWMLSETIKPRNSGCCLVFLKNWQANWSSCKHRICMNPNTVVQWGKWSTVTPWEYMAVFFQYIRWIQFYFTIALVVVYSVSYLLHLEVLDLQLIFELATAHKPFSSPLGAIPLPIRISLESLQCLSSLGHF